MSINSKNIFLSSFYSYSGITSNGQHIEIFFSLIEEKVYTACLALSFFLIPFCICRVQEKIRMVKDPKINNSYCVISEAMLNLIQYSLWYLLMLDALFLVLIVFDAKLDDKLIVYKILWVL